MRRCFPGLLFGLSILIILYSSCTEEAKQVQETTTAKPVMRKVSELVNLMFKMEGDLKMLRTGLIDDSTFSQIGQFNYEDIFTAEVSKDVKRDSVYVVNGTAYLKELHQLSQTTTKDAALISFNGVVDACVTCHLSYCPGPVARIKKLAIN